MRNHININNKFKSKVSNKNNKSSRFYNSESGDDYDEDEITDSIQSVTGCVVVDRQSETEDDNYHLHHKPKKKHQPKTSKTITESITVNNSSFNSNDDKSINKDHNLITNCCHTSKTSSALLNNNSLDLSLNEDENKLYVENTSKSDMSSINILKSSTTILKTTDPMSNKLFKSKSPSPYHQSVSSYQNNPAIPANSRIRNDSIRQFTDRLRTFSIDFLRTIELAQDMADLKNSNFAAATQSAAVQHLNTYEQTTNDLNNDLNNSKNFLAPNYKTRNIFFDRDRATTARECSSRHAELGESNSRLHASSASMSGFNIGSLKEVSSLKKSYSDLVNDNIKHIPVAISKEKITTTNEIKTTASSEDDAFDSPDTTNNNNINKNETPVVPVKRKSSKYRIKILIPDDIHISILEVFIYLWGVVTFFADLISDIILSIEYFENSNTWLGFLTLMFVIVPNVTLSLFSLSWYIDNYYATKNLKMSKININDKNKANGLVNNVSENNEGESSSNAEALGPSTSTCDSITFWITTIFFIVFQLDLVLKYVQGFIYTLKGWACRSVYKNLGWEKYYIEKQIKCDTDIGMLRLIDVFMDSGPQVLLQLYVITTQNLNESGSGNLVVFTFKDFKTTSLELKQFVSILSSLFSMGYALAGYHRCLRNQQFIFCLETNKPLPRPMSWLSTMMQFLWYLFLIAPRVLSMAIFASTFRSWFFMIIFAHWLIMYFWILRLKTNYCITSQDVYSAREEIFEKFYDFVCSFIYIFVYFNLKSGPTRLRYLIYYIIYYSENVIFCVCYFVFSKETNFTYKISMLFIVIMGFWVAITFQVIYYLHCHPSHDIRVCVRKKKEFHFIHKQTLKPTSDAYGDGTVGCENGSVTSMESNKSIEKSYQNKVEYDYDDDYYFRVSKFDLALIKIY